MYNRLWRVQPAHSHNLASLLGLSIVVATVGLGDERNSVIVS